MVLQNHVPRDGEGMQMQARPSFRRLLIWLICLMLGCTAVYFFCRPRADDLSAQIQARLGELGVEPGTVDTIFQKALRVRAAIAAGDFTTANQITTAILADSQVQNWRFYPFEDFIAAVFAATPEGFGSRLDDWIATDHAGSLPELFRAQYDFNTGWAARGHGFSNQTTPPRIAAFLADMTKALADVDDAIHLDDRNPYSFYLKLRILQGGGITPAFSAAFDDAVGKFPAYYPLYDITLSTLQPRWGGNIPAMYAFADKYAGGAPRFSPLKLLYLRLYSYLLSTGSVDCSAAGGDHDKTTQCVTAFMQKASSAGLEESSVAALQLYDHTDKYQFGLAAKPIISNMLDTAGGDSYSGAVLEFAATAMHSDTQRVEENPGHNDYVVDELVGRSWWRKGYADNAIKKYVEAVAAAKNTKFPSEEERDVALGRLYETLSDAASWQHQYVDEIAYEKAAVLLGATSDEHYICHGYYELQRYEDAIEACTDAIKSTNNPYAYYWRGEAYNHSDRPDQALADLTKSADLEGFFASSAAIDMTLIYFNRNDDQDALDVLNKYTFLYDSNRTSKAQVAVAYNNRCYAYMQLGELNKALDDCTQSLRYGSIPDAFRKKQQLMERLNAPGAQGRGI